MGSKNRYLETGRWYTYELKYRVPKAILQYEDHDLLYWNAIPFHWAFPIQSADIVVRFPEGFVTRDIEIKSGRFGDKHNYILRPLTCAMARVPWTVGLSMIFVIRKAENPIP